MAIDVILSRLEKVKRTGRDSWTARCPAHDDRGPSLSLRDNGGMILLHCFAGCEVSAILTSLDVDFADLFPERPEHRSPPAGARRRFNPYDICEAVAMEAMIVEIVAGDVHRQKAVAAEDWERLLLATRRIHGAVEVMRG